MAVTHNGKTEFIGATITTYSHYWLDGMEEEIAIVWDMESHETKHITFGYYGADGYNLAGGKADIDVTTEVIRDMVRTFKRNSLKDFCKSVTDEKKAVRKDRNVVVVKGRKVKPGTELKVFWVGEKPTYNAVRYGYNETETLAGCFDSNGNKVWIKADYLKVTDSFKSPNAKERKKFIDAYVKAQCKYYGIDLRTLR